jgi:DNA recombination-dependent growth factor C
VSEGAAVSFVLDEEGTLKRLRLPEAEDDAPAEDPQAALDAALALLGPTLARLTHALLPALGGLAEPSSDA